MTRFWFLYFVAQWPLIFFSKQIEQFFRHLTVKYLNKKKKKIFFRSWSDLSDFFKTYFWAPTWVVLHCEKANKTHKVYLKQELMFKYEFCRYKSRKHLLIALVDGRWIFFKFFSLGNIFGFVYFNMKLFICLLTRLAKFSQIILNTSSWKWKNKFLESCLQSLIVSSPNMKWHNCVYGLLNKQIVDVYKIEQVIFLFPHVVDVVFFADNFNCIHFPMLSTDWMKILNYPHRAKAAKLSNSIVTTRSVTLRCKPWIAWCRWKEKINSGLTWVHSRISQIFFYKG